MIKFRKLKLSDRKEVRILFDQLTKETPSFNIKLVLKDKNCNCIVAEDKGKVIGFGALVLAMVPCRGYFAKIEDVVVDEKYRGKGLGKKLIQELIKIAKKKKVKKINLTSNPKRVEARKFYESMGFEIYDTGVFRMTLE